MTGYCCWKDEKICEINEDIDAFIEVENRELKEFEEIAAGIEERPFKSDECKISILHEEIIRYHHQYNLIEKQI